MCGRQREMQIQEGTIRTIKQHGRKKEGVSQPGVHEYSAIIVSKKKKTKKKDDTRTVTAANKQSLLRVEESKLKTMKISVYFEFRLRLGKDPVLRSPKCV